jgi:hypothetical protein
LLHTAEDFVNANVACAVQHPALTANQRCPNANNPEETEMWGGIIGLIIQLVAGGVGGNVAGSMMKQYDLGTIGNTIAGVVGGGVGAQIIGQFLGGGADVAGGGSLDIGSIIGQIASGGVGGGVLMVIVGLIKQAMGGQRPA